MKQQLLAWPSVLLLLYSCFLLNGCSENGASPDDSVANLALTGQVWKVVAFENLAEETEEAVATYELYTLDFKDTQASGYVGCHDFTASYQRSGDEGVAFTDVVATGEGCAVHTHSAEFLAGLGSVEKLEIRGQQLRLVYAGGAKALRFHPAEFVSNMELDVDGNGAMDVQLSFETIFSEDILAHGNIDLYTAHGIGETRVLGGVEDSGKFAVPLLRGMSINNQPAPPFTWQFDAVLARRESSIVRPGFWEGTWSVGSSYYLGVRLVQDGDPYYGWVHVQLMVDEPIFNVRILDFFFKKQVGVGIRAGER